MRKVYVYEFEKKSLTKECRRFTTSLKYQVTKVGHV